MALGGVPMGSAKSMLAAIATATNSAAGFTPAAGATTRTSAPTMAMIAMFDMSAPTITVNATTASTKRNWLDGETTADMLCSKNNPSPSFLSAMALPRPSAAAFKVSVPHSTPLTASSQVIANFRSFQSTGITNSKVAINMAVTDQSRCCVTQMLERAKVRDDLG